MHTESYWEKFKSARIKRGLTQAQLAEKLGYSPSTIGMYEQGRRIPNCYTFLEICKVLGITTQDVFADNKGFNVDQVLKYIIDSLKREKNVRLNGIVLGEPEKNNISYVLKLILNKK